MNEFLNSVLQKGKLNVQISLDAATVALTAIGIFVAVFLSLFLYGKMFK